MPSVSLFVGPTAYGVAPSVLAAPGMTIRPPARRGDIEALLQSTKRPAVIVLCDGIFHDHPAVSHAELCQALDAGWQVWGVSSLGAIRAFELRDEGMRGFGYVRAQFDRHDDFTDDEMSLLYFPEPPYFPISEPLVNLRYALEERRSALGIETAAAKRALRSLRELWFGDRTLARMRQALIEDGRVAAATADALLAWLQANRAKTLDLIAVLEARPWQRVVTR